MDKSMRQRLAGEIIDAERNRAYKEDNDYVRSLARHIDALEADNTRLSKSNKALVEETLTQEKEIIYLEEQLHMKSIELAYLKSNSNTTPPEERVDTMIEYRVSALEERVDELEESQ